MNYHQTYFQAMSYFIIAQEEYKQADQNAEGMGKAVSYLKATTQIFDKAKLSLSSIPPNYADNFNKKMEELAKVRDKAITENKTIYFEKEIPFEQLPKPDCQNFVKLEATLGDLQVKHPLEDKLRHIVPPQVRVMAD